MTQQENKCIICGKDISERRLKDGKKTCCRHCQMLTPESKEKRSKIAREVQSNPEVKQKQREASLRNWQNPVYRANCCNGQKIAQNKPEVKEKVSKGLKAYHASERHQEFIAAMNKPETIANISKAQLARFADEEKHEAFVQSMNKPSTKEKLKNAMSQGDTRLKIHNAKKKNNSYGKSSWEDKSYELLLTKFDKVNIERQYFDKERYPFNCDFYVKSLDLFIECHYGWHHNGRLFDSNNQKDLDELELLQEKAKTSKNYQNKIYQWTDLDVRKAQCIKDNNLNWLVFYTLGDFEQWLNNLI